MKIVGLAVRKSAFGQLPGRDAALRRPGRRSAPTLPKTNLRAALFLGKKRTLQGGGSILYWAFKEY
jgi:hypothetical protein